MGCFESVSEEVEESMQCVSLWFVCRLGKSRVFKYITLRAQNLQRWSLILQAARHMVNFKCVNTETQPSACIKSQHLLKCLMDGSLATIFSEVF